jgi:hypothetical protein
MLRSYSALFCMLAIVGNALSQPLSKAPAPLCSFSELYRKDGWAIPGLEGARIKGQRMAFNNLAGVYVTMLEPATSESIITDVWCSRDHDGRIEIEDRPIRVLNLWSFDVGGRKFAYGLSYGVEAIQNGKRIPVGTSAALMFYDVDGSGRFKVLRGAKFPFVPDMVPDWAKTGNDTSNK